MITNSSLDCRFLLCLAAAVVVAAITTGVHLAVDKLGEVDNKVLVLAGSKREIEIGLVVDRFHEQLQGKRERVLAGSRISRWMRTWTQILPLSSLIS